MTDKISFRGTALMWDRQPSSGIKVVSDENMLEGFHARWRNGEVVHVGPLEPLPIDCDQVTVHPNDYEEIRKVVSVWK